MSFNLLPSLFVLERSALWITLLFAARACGATVVLQNATATLSQAGGWNVGTVIDGVINAEVGWAVYNFSLNQAQAETAVFETSADVGFAGGSLFTFRLSQVNHNPQHTIGRFRLSVTTDSRDNFADGLANGGDVSATWTVLAPSTALATGGIQLDALSDGSILASGANPNNSVYTVTAGTTMEHITGIRLEVMEDASLPFNGPGRYPSNGNFVLSEFELDVVPVPEPSAVLLLSCAGLALVTWRMLNRRRSGRGAS